MGLNVGSILRSWALAEPERVASIDHAASRREVSYGALDLGARAFAAKLLAAGVAPGDRVALSAENGVGYLTAYFGTLYAGAAVVPIPISSAPPEVRFRLEHARCRLLVHDAARGPVAAEAAGDRTPRLAVPTQEDAAGPAPVDVPASLAPDAVAMVLYTSGTTGTPKGACITHASLLTHTAALVTHALELDEATVALAVLPLTHSYGIRIAVLAPFYCGGRVVLLPRFDAHQALCVARAEGVTFLPAVPTMFSAWSRLPTEEATAAWPDLRWCLSAGAPLPDELCSRAAARLGAEVRQGYGLTEATFTSVDSPGSAGAAGSVGRPVFGVEVAIVDEAGARLGPDQAGEILVRGQNVMAGYLDDEAATAAAFLDGWLRSGDVGALSADGVLTVVDRTKDLILRGGNNVYPSEVEGVLVQHPRIAEAAVVGLPDDHYGEEVVAVLRLVGDAALEPAELLAFCRARLAAFKCPRAFAFVEAFPLGPSNKVLKRALRDQLRSESLSLVR